MIIKNALVFFVQLFFVQVLFVINVFSQCCTGRESAIDILGAKVYDGPTAYETLADWVVSGIYPDKLSTLKLCPTSGGVFAVKSRSAMPPAGITVVSNNAFEGIVKVAGELPFIGASMMKGLMPTLGTGIINHSCGNGLNALSSLSLVSSPGSHETTEDEIPCVVFAQEPASTEPVLPACVANAEFEVPYTASLEPVLAEPVVTVPSFDTHILPAPAITDPNFELAVTYSAPALASISNEPILPVSSFVASILPAQGYDGISYRPYEEGLLTVPCDTEFTITNIGNLPVTSASMLPPTGISLSSATAYGGPLLIAGELPFIGTVGVEGVVPTAGAGDVSHVCGDAINIMGRDKTVFAPEYAVVTFPPEYGFSPVADNLPGYGYCWDSVIKNYGQGP